MFDQEIRASFAAQGRAMAEQINKLAADSYVLACQNWALQPMAPKPSAPFSLAASVAFDPAFSLTLVPTQSPVSDIKPESFLPKYGTDVNAVGGPVGGPIPGSSDKFYAASGANPQAGDDYKTNGAVYVYKRPTPFGGFWVKVL